MGQEHLLLNTFIFLAAASLMVPLASRFKLGSVIGYLIVGMLIGPFGFRLIGNADQIMNFAEFGVVMMLFLIGLELEPNNLWHLRKLIVGLGGLQVLLTSGLLTFLGIVVLGYSWTSSLAIGMALSLSSTALVLQMLQEKNLMKTAEGETSFAVLLFQDIAVIAILIIMPLLSPEGSIPIAKQEASFINQLSPWLHALLVAVIITSLILMGHYFSRHLFRMIAKTNVREVFTAFSLALVVGITLLMESIGVSPALGAFIAGLVLASSQYKHTVEADIQPFKGLLLGLFFISVGMSINFTLFSEQVLLILGIVLGLIIIKALILTLLGRAFHLTKIQRIGFALALSQGSEFAFVLFQYAGESKVISPELRAEFTLIVALSMLATPFLMLLYHRFIVPQLMSNVPKRKYDTVHEQNAIILAGYGRFGQIIGRLLHGEKIKVTVLEKNTEQIELLRKYGYPGYFGDASRLDLLKSAGADQAKLLIVAVGDTETNLKIVRLAKQAFPHLKIYARARNRRHAYELDKAGVDYFKRELFDSSLTMTKEVLKFLGYKQADIEKKAAAFQKLDETTLIQSFEFFDEEQDQIHFARQVRKELERLLQES